MLFTFPSRYWFTIGLSRVFSLTGWSRWIHAEFLVLRATQDYAMVGGEFVYGIVTFCDAVFQQLLLSSLRPLMRSYNPTEAGTSVVWAFPCSLATTGGIIVYFLFLPLLRCFSSRRLLPSWMDNRSSTCWVVPFGDLRIKDYLHLPVAFRSLSRPSSPVRA